MKLSYEFFIALRYLKSRKKHRGISFNTFVSIAGICLGVMALIVVLGVMTGAHEDMRNKILGVNAHLVVLNFAGGIENYDLVISKIERTEGVTAAAPFVMGQVMIARGKTAHGVYMRGVDPKYEEKVTILKKKIKEGSFEALKEKAPKTPPLIIGSELAALLGVFPGDKVRVISPIMKPGPMGLIPKVREFRVAGIFEVGMFEYDANLVITNLRAAQEFFGLGNEVTGIEVKIKDIFQAPKMRQKLTFMLGRNYYARDWIQMNRTLFSALKLEKFAMFVILCLIIVVAAFNIVSTLVMNVMEKEREIAILKAMGTTNRSIMRIFILQGLIIGLIGTVIGIIGGYGLGYVIGHYKLIKLPADVYYISHLPVKMKPFDFIVVSISAILICLLATVYPARQAAKLNPVEPLRYE